MVVCCTLQPDCSVMLQGLWSLAVFSFFLILFDVACMLPPSLRDKFITIPIDVSQERPPACLGPVAFDKEDPSAQKGRPTGHDAHKSLMATYAWVCAYFGREPCRSTAS